jgi:hypothetical protein
MDGLQYDRLCRTPHSEAYLITRDGEALGRVDMHFAHTTVYGMLVLEQDVEGEELDELLGQIDDDLVWSADVPRDDFVVTVYRGTEIGVYSDVDADDEAEPLVQP